VVAHADDQEKKQGKPKNKIKNKKWQSSIVYLYNPHVRMVVGMIKGYT